MEPNDELEPVPDEGAAAWAHNRWPTIGLFTGAGVAGATALLIGLNWLMTLAWAFGGGVVGCICGFVLASLVYPQR